MAGWVALEGQFEAKLSLREGQLSGATVSQVETHKAFQLLTGRPSPPHRSRATLEGPQ